MELRSRADLRVGLSVGGVDRRKIYLGSGLALWVSPRPERHGWAPVVALDGLPKFRALKQIQSRFAVVSHALAWPISEIDVTRYHVQESKRVLCVYSRRA